MSTSIFVCLPTELVGLHHVVKSRLDLKVAIDLCSRSNADVVRSGSLELMDQFVRHDFEL